MKGFVLIGLTGGIASGKSTVTDILRDEMGCTVLDADKYGHAAYKKGTPCYDKLISHFGQEIVNEADGEINRKQLGSIVFSDQLQMRELESIVWPEIRALISADLSAMKSKADEGGEGKPQVAVLEAAIMIEAGWQDMVDVLWVVSVDRDTARARLQARNNLSPEEADKRIDAQMSNSDRCKYADFVVSNAGSKDELLAETRRLYALSLEKLASGHV
jgi:dephospho-CoA kinase